MKTNFDLEDNYALLYQGRHLDLHNIYDFSGFDYKLADQQLRLHWVRGNGNWVNENEFYGLILVHHNVSFLRIIERDPELPFTEDTCLATVSYYPSSDRENNKHIVNKAIPDEGDDIVYNFQSQQIIRVYCEEIELIPF